MSEHQLLCGLLLGIEEIVQTAHWTMIRKMQSEIYEMQLQSDALIVPVSDLRATSSFQKLYLTASKSITLK
jgi:hypothetical protein